MDWRFPAIPFAALPPDQVNKDPQAPLDRLVRRVQEHRAQQALQAQVGPLALRVSRVPLELLAQLAQRVPLVLSQAPPDPPARRDPLRQFRDLLDLLALTAQCPAQRVQQDRLVRRPLFQDQQDQQVLRERIQPHLGQPDQLVQLEPVALLVLPDRPARCRDLLAQPDPLDLPERIRL